MIEYLQPSKMRFLKNNFPSRGNMLIINFTKKGGRCKTLVILSNVFFVCSLLLLFFPADRMAHFNLSPTDNYLNSLIKFLYRRYINVKFLA